ncbi:uncharacterized protein LOC127794532 isoform X2 [Diospyros lotus]|uniref:uncharacterized protein LOC127794532 isoform X2 n=1 Tax=Diospyros lotus TaxID=55363 RepID=UPI002254B416|nr:uncharacterized protein LOC127794532 isoform X2 [Diospyros lotus]
MSSRRGGGSNGGGLQSIPVASRKMVQSLKEIVNCPEPEIYAMLQECNMDANDAVNRLLSQDPFHEVKSKREKKKENKDTAESRPRGSSNTSSRGLRGGTDRYAVHGGSNQLSSSEPGTLYGKHAYKKENGMNNHIILASVSSGMAGNNMHRSPMQSDPVTTQSKAMTGMLDINLLSSQTSSGYQPAWSGVPGQVSMADIVKMGRSNGKTLHTANQSRYGVNHHDVQASQPNAWHHDLYSSKDHFTSKVSELNPESGVVTGQHASANDDWPLLEQPPVASMPPALESSVASEMHTDTSILSSKRTNWQPESSKDEAKAVEDASIENVDTTCVEPASVFSRKIQEDNSGGASPFDNDIYKNMDSHLPQVSAFDHQDVEEIGASVTSVTSNLQQLNVQEDCDSLSEERNLPVIIPDHLQVQDAECLHLSFGSFGSGKSATFSEPFSSRSLTGNMQEAPVEADTSSAGHSETRNPDHYTDEPLGTSTDGNLIHRTGASAGSYDPPASAPPEVLKQENSEAPHENQYIFPSPSNYNFESGQQNAAFPHSQTSSHMQNLAPMSSVMESYTSSLPGSLLATSVEPVRESDLPYSPFPMTQSMATKYGNTMPSISGSTISMPETVGFPSTQSTTHPLPGSTIASGPALPQHLAMHPYSQASVHLGPFANMIGYPFLPQSYALMPSAFQQAFAGNSTYHQSLAAVPPQYKNSVSGSSLPQSAAIASGYGGFGSSSSIPGNFPVNPPPAPGASSISYDDMLSSQYKENNHLISLQQNENSAMWVHGPGSRTMSAVPASTYYSFQGLNQQPTALRQSQQPSQNYGALGYPNFYHSHTGISLEHQQQQQNPREMPLGGGGSQGQPSKQSQQIWQNSY